MQKAVYRLVSRAYAVALTLAHIVVHRTCAEAGLNVRPVENAAKADVFSPSIARIPAKQGTCHKMHQQQFILCIQSFSIVQKRLRTILSTNCVQKCLNVGAHVLRHSCLIFMRGLKVVCFQQVIKSGLRLLTKLSTECVRNVEQVLCA
jgi:hypothetical protein